MEGLEELMDATIETFSVGIRIPTAFSRSRSPMICCMTLKILTASLTKERFKASKGELKGACRTDRLIKKSREELLLAYLLPSHHLGNGNSSSEDEPSFMSREVLSGIVRL